MEQRVVTSGSCSNGTCSILISSSGTCLVRVQAISPYGNSTSMAVNIGKNSIAVLYMYVFNVFKIYAIL